MYRFQLLLTATLVLAPLASAQAGFNLDSKCGLESNYGIEFDADRIGFTRKADHADGGVRIEFLGGGIRIDGEALQLTPADRQRVQRFERQVQVLVPEVRKIAADGVEIAFIALSRVATHFASDGRRDALLQELDALRQEAVQVIAEARSNEALRDSTLEQRFEAAVARMVPVIAGEFAAQAVSAAMSGDQQAVADIERRTNSLGGEIERSVEGAAKSLEARVATLCPQFEALDRIENSFEWRMPDGSHPQLLEFRADGSAHATDKG
jgi:hypothetical protein